MHIKLSFDILFFISETQEALKRAGKSNAHFVGCTEQDESGKAYSYGFTKEFESKLFPKYLVIKTILRKQLLINHLITLGNPIYVSVAIAICGPAYARQIEAKRHETCQRYEQTIAQTDGEALSAS